MRKKKLLLLLLLLLLLSMKMDVKDEMVEVEYHHYYPPYRHEVMVVRPKEDVIQDTYILLISSTSNPWVKYYLVRTQTSVEGSDPSRPDMNLIHRCWTGPGDDENASTTFDMMPWMMRANPVHVPLHRDGLGIDIRWMTHDVLTTDVRPDLDSLDHPSVVGDHQSRSRHRVKSDPTQAAAAAAADDHRSDQIPTAYVGGARSAADRERRR